MICRTENAGLYGDFEEMRYWYFSLSAGNARWRYSVFRTQLYKYWIPECRL